MKNRIFGIFFLVSIFCFLGSMVVVDWASGMDVTESFVLTDTTGDVTADITYHQRGLTRNNYSLGVRGFDGESTDMSHTFTASPATIDVATGINYSKQADTAGHSSLEEKIGIGSAETTADTVQCFSAAAGAGFAYNTEVDFSSSAGTITTPPTTSYAVAARGEGNFEADAMGLYQETDKSTGEEIEYDRFQSRFKTRGSYDFTGEIIISK